MSCGLTKTMSLFVKPQRQYKSIEVVSQTFRYPAETRNSRQRKEFRMLLGRLYGDKVRISIEKRVAKKVLFGPFC